MKKNLAIKGHATRGEEVIELLGMLGGSNDFEHIGNNPRAIYYIDETYENFITCSETKKACDCIIFTLEEFLEKFPYKVGDRVRTIYGKIGIISKPIWSKRDDCIRYELEADTDSFYFVNELQPYKEDIVEERNNDSWAKWDLPDGYEFQDKEGNVINTDIIKLVKKQPQYPKTYEECCEIIHSDPKFYVDTHLYSDTLEVLYKLLICRDAYWKIAGKEMGLDKPWEPDWNNSSQFKDVIICRSNNIIKYAYAALNTILAFPTEEMRDAFYENFKDLIEECKEFL